MNVLLWNVQRKLLEQPILGLVEQHQVDLLILIEHPRKSKILATRLQTLGPFERLPSAERFGVYCRLKLAHKEGIRPFQENDRMNFWRLGPVGAVDFVLAVVHGLDRRNHSESKRGMLLGQVVSNVSRIEDALGHKRTVVVGDLNANPFEPAVGGVKGLHAIQMKVVNGRTKRRVLGTEYEFFYNPMWCCYGRGIDPPATYYHNRQEEHELFWHMLDQVVLRPEMLPYFVENQLRVLNRAGDLRLLNERGVPDKTMASDHLPILFRLNLNRKRGKHAP